MCTWVGALMMFSQSVQIGWSLADGTHARSNLFLSIGTRRALVHADIRFQWCPAFRHHTVVSMFMSEYLLDMHQLAVAFLIQWINQLFKCRGDIQCDFPLKAHALRNVVQGHCILHQNSSYTCLVCIINHSGDRPPITLYFGSLRPNTIHQYPYDAIASSSSSKSICSRSLALPALPFGRLVMPFLHAINSAIDCGILGPKSSTEDSLL